MAKFIDLDTGLPALLNKVKAWVNSKTEDFITAEDAAGIVAATGDLVIVERDNYIDILITESQVNITPASLALYAAQKSAVIKVSGIHLKNDISISVPTGFTATPSTIAQVGGTVAQTDVTIAYTLGDATTASGNITATAGDVVKSIPVAYSQYAGPTILADSTLTIKAAAGQSNTGSLQVTGLNLTAGINASVSGTGFTVSNTENGTYGDQASLPSSGGTLYVKFSPTGSTGSTGTLTLESTGATSKTVDLTGAVVSLTVSESSLSFSTTAGTPATQTFTVQGANLSDDISISVSGTGFSVSPVTIDKDNAGTAQTVTVTYNPSAAGNHTGTVTIQSSGLSETIDLSGSATAVPVGNYIQEGLVFHLDGIEKGSVSGKWIDCKGGAEWVNHGATSLQNGFSFDGVDDYFEGVDSGVYTDDAYTIEVAFDSETSGSVYFVFVDAYGREIMCYVPNFQSKEWYLSKSAAAKKNNPNPYGAIVVNGDGGTGVKIVSLTTAATGTNGGVVNGVAKSTNICEYSCDAIGRIGCRRKDSVNNFFFKGKVYSVRIYNRRLTTSEMKQNQAEDNTRFNLGLTIE